jgi:hypothetical protein
VVLSAIEWPNIENNVVRILAAVNDAVPGSLQAVECGVFSRKKPTGESY